MTATADFINESIDAVVTVLKASAAFMSSRAPEAPDGADGVVCYVERGMPETTKIPDHRLPHASVIYLEHVPTADHTPNVWEYEVAIGIRLYHRGADRDAVWTALQKAVAAVSVAVEAEMRGGRFGELAIIATDRGGQAVDVQENTGYGAAIATGITLLINHISP